MKRALYSSVALSGLLLCAPAALADDSQLIAVANDSIAQPVGATPLWGDLESFWGDLESFWGDLESFNGESQASWGDLESFWGDLESFWGDL